MAEIEKYITVALEPMSAFITIIDEGSIYEFRKSCYDNRKGQLYQPAN